MSESQSSIETFLDHADRLFGSGECLKITAETDRPHVWVVKYQDVPDDGSLTALTYGLSSVGHPDWKLGRPELLISVHSANVDWALAVGFLAKQGRGVYPFSIGSTIRFGRPIAMESQMSAFFTFASNLLDPEEAAISLSDRKINIVQLYPIYAEEIRLVEDEGAARFFAREDLDLSDVSRRNLGQPDR